MHSLCACDKYQWAQYAQFYSTAFNRSCRSLKGTLETENKGVTKIYYCAYLFKERCWKLFCLQTYTWWEIIIFSFENETQFLPFQGSGEECNNFSQNSPLSEQSFWGSSGVQALKKRVALFCCYNSCVSEEWEIFLGEWVRPFSIQKVSDAFSQKKFHLNIVK